MNKRNKSRLKLIFGVIIFVLVIGLMLWDVMRVEYAGNRGGSFREELVMGTEPGFKPFEHLDGDEVVGFDVDLAREIAKDMGRELRVEQMAFDGLLVALQTGRVDIVAAGMTVTPEREKNAAFSTSYYTSAQRIVVRKGERIRTAQDLKGRRIGVQLGTTGDDLAHKIEGARVSQFPAVSSLMQELDSGRIDAAIIDNEPARRYSAQYDNLVVVERSLTSEDYAIAMRKDDIELQKQVNQSIKNMKADGRYDELIKKYFPETREVKD